MLRKPLFILSINDLCNYRTDSVRIRLLICKPQCNSVCSCFSLFRRLCLWIPISVSYVFEQDWQFRIHKMSLCGPSCTRIGHPTVYKISQHIYILGYAQLIVRAWRQLVKYTLACSQRLLSYPPPCRVGIQQQASNHGTVLEFFDYN